MKKLIASLFILYSIFPNFSCNKSEEKCETIYQDGGSMGVSIKSTESFEYNLRLLEHKTDVTIIQQPNHFQISLVENDAANQVFKYKYKPAITSGLTLLLFSPKTVQRRQRLTPKYIFPLQTK